MDEILEEIDSKIEENQYYLDNFEFINDKTKIINEALGLFNNNNAEAAVEKLYNITRYDLIKLFVLCTRFFDSKEEHEKLTDFISFLMHDGKNRDFKKKKFDILFRLILLVSGEKRMIINEEEKTQLDLLKKAFIQIYSEED